MEYIKRFIWGVENEAFIGNREIVGCSNKEIEKIENNAQEKGWRLPKSYIEFLTFGGHKVGAMLRNCDYNYDFCLQQIEKYNSSYFMFLKSWSDKFYFRIETDEEDPYVYYLDADGNFVKEGIFSDFLITHLGYYNDARKRIPLVTRLGLAIMRQNLVELQYIYVLYKDTAIWRSIERVITLIDTLHNKGKDKIASANHDFIGYLEGLAIKCGKTDFVTTNDCQKYISSVKEYFFLGRNTHADIDLLKELKYFIYEDINKDTTNRWLSATEYFENKSLIELNINSTDDVTRIRAKWLRPQLIYYYNQLTNPFTRKK